MTRLYLMRHGQTLFNTLNRIQGWCDSPLTEKGREQARQVRAYFEKHDTTFDQYYCTTTERASDTIELATGRTDYHRIKGLKEMHFGILKVNQSIFIPRHLLWAILATTMPSLVEKVKISSLRVWLRVLRR